MNPQIPKDPGALASLDRLTRHIRVFGKFFRRIQQLNCKKFVLLPMCTDIVMYYWSQVVQATSVPPNFIDGQLPFLSNFETAKFK